MEKVTHQDLTNSIGYLFKSRNLKKENWQVNTNFTKGFLSKKRGVSVEVYSVVHNIRKKRSFSVATKSNARTKALECVSMLIDEIIDEN